VQKRNKAVSNGRPIFARIYLARQGIEWVRIISEETQFEDSLWKWEVQLTEIGVKASIRRPKVWNSSRCADTGADLNRVRRRMGNEGG
jgi:hypothetical protein